LGHAARCIPLIRALRDCDFEPVIASDGIALAILQKEFPDLQSLALPSYNITYAKNGQFFKLKMLQNSPKMIAAIKAEKKATKTIVETHRIAGILSDNRLGVYCKDIPSVFMTHQLKVLSGNTTWISTKMHQKIINRFDECWVPDNMGEHNLSGKLSHIDGISGHVKFIGPLSRFTKSETELKYDILVLLSGPEPQRTFLEEVLFKELKAFQGKILFIKGVVEPKQSITEHGNMTIYNFMTSDLLERAINESRLVISRSGYTTIMDLAKLHKKAFFIPTPGQFEQEYLAKRLAKDNIVPSCRQNDFTLEKLNDISDFKGLQQTDYQTNYKRLFSLFQGE